MATSKLFRRVKQSASYPLAPYRDEETRTQITTQRPLRVTMPDSPAPETTPGPQPRFFSNGCRCRLS